jgi:hypothetical protein
VEAEVERDTQKDRRKRLKALWNEKVWWREVFVPDRLLPFSTLYIDGAAADDKPLLLYRARKFFHAAQVLHPCPDDLRSDHPALLPYALDQWFVCSIDGGAFVAFDAPDTNFFRHYLPSHLRDQYFLLFIVTLHQRFALMNLSDHVAQGWSITRGEEDKREAVFRDIRDALLMFTARGNFVQVMQQENHHRCYRKWQETFQIAELYREVCDEVHEMHQYLLMEQNERIEQAQKEQEEKAEKRVQSLQNSLSFLGILIGGPSLILGFLGINIKSFTAGEGITMQEAAKWGFGGGLALGLTIALTIWGIGLWMGKARG